MANESAIATLAVMTSSAYMFDVISCAAAFTAHARPMKVPSVKIFWCRRTSSRFAGPTHARLLDSTAGSGIKPKYDVKTHCALKGIAHQNITR
eukprot:31342-Pelagococcus_subviridis.AAC.33